MRTQNQEQRQPCRHGLNCRYLPTNNCRFYHPPNNTLPHPHRQNHPKVERKSTSRPKQHNHTQSYTQNNNNHNNSYSHDGKSKEDLTKLLCRDFHMGHCKYADKCERLHQFLFQSPQGLRRLQQHREIPSDPSARLSRVGCEGKEVLSLRQGGEAVLFEYNFEEGQLGALGVTVGLPVKCEYYQQREMCFYYSSENDTTRYSDMGFQDLETNETSWITNCHTGKITGMAHWDKHTLLSSSAAGDIKVWNRGEEGFVLNKEATEQLLTQYNPHNKPIEILFLDAFTLNEVRIMAAGTNDGRLLFWSGSGFEFMEFAVGPRYAKVFKARLMQVGEGLSAAVLVWNAQNTLSAALLLDLQTSGVRVLKEVETGEKFTRHLHLLECHEEYVLVGCLRGELGVYNLREGRKVGAILHQNAVTDVVCSTLEMKTTGVRVNLLYLLEKRTRETEGSFAIYLLQ